MSQEYWSVPWRLFYEDKGDGCLQDFVRGFIDKSRETVCEQKKIGSELKITI